MADFEGTYLTCRADTEVAATPRTLKAIIEDYLNVTLQGVALVNGLTIQNESAEDLRVSHTSTAATHYITIGAGLTRQLVYGGNRVPLGDIYVKVATDSNVFAIECALE